MSKDELINNAPSYKVGLDDFYGKQTVSNLMQSFADEQVKEAEIKIYSSESENEKLRNKLQEAEDRIKSIKKLIDTDIESKYLPMAISQTLGDDHKD